MYPVQLDLLIRTAVHATAQPGLTWLAFALSALGAALSLSVLFLLAASALARTGHGRMAWTLAWVMAGEIVLQNGLKLLVARPRPAAFFGVSPESFGFPSGHALSAVCFFGALALILGPRLRSRAWLVGVAVLLSAGIGWSRIYLGVHQPSDVIGGWGIGVVWLGVVGWAGGFRNPGPLPSPVPVGMPPDPARRRMLVVMSRNPGSVRDRPAMQARLRQLMQAAGLEPEFADLEKPGMKAAMARAMTDGSEAIVAAGGDGTISFVGQALVGHDTPLGVIALGTMNLFARDLGIPLDDLPAAVAVLAAGQVRRVDVGDVNGHAFLCGSMLGLPARLAQYRKRGGTLGESLLLWVRYGRAVLRALVRFRPFRATMSVDGRRVRLGASSLMVTPNAMNEASGPLLGRSDLTGGWLAVYVLGRLRLRDLLRLLARVLLARMLMRRWSGDRLVTVYRMRRLAIGSRSPALRVMNDGEVLLLAPPLRYRLRPRALSVLCPPETAEA